MAERIDLPPTLQGDEKSQLQQVWSYLYQLSEAINNNLDAIGGNELTDRERQSMQQILQAAGVTQDGVSTDYETLKSLIIKTADFVQTSLQEYRMKLLGETVASGQFGRYVRQTGLDVEVTPEGITQNYSLREIAEDLKHYEVNAKNYIKTGLLRTVSSIPVYGVAIGKDIVTFSEDGTETYNDGNKVAELTADELSFWQSSEKIASYTGSEIIFYSGGTARVKINSSGIIFLNGTTKLAEFLTNALKFYCNGTESFYIQNGNIYAEDDLNIGSGKKVKIGNWSFEESGIKYDNNEVSRVLLSLGYNAGNDSFKFMIEQPNLGEVYAAEITGGLYKYNHGYIVTGSKSRMLTDILEATEIWAKDIDYTDLHQTSSRDVKHGILDMEDVGDRLDQLRPVTFIYNDDKRERRRVGLIYEEARPVMPEICTAEGSAKAINYVELIPMLLKEIQDLRARVKALEER